MVKAFKFSRLPEIIFRNGSIADLPTLVTGKKGPLVLLTGNKSFTESQKGQKLFQSLRDKNIPFIHIRIPGEPTPAMIDGAIEKARNENPSMVVAIGGGSVLDAGKAISAMITVEGSIKEYLEGVGTRTHPGSRLPFIACPSTSGTGSEATKNAVISEIGKAGFKKSLRHDNFVPDLALIDPELSLACPPDLTAASGMDCFTQLTEAYLSDQASVYTDAFALDGLKAIRSSLVNAVSDGSNIGARSGMSLAALNSGICLANAGLGTVHGFASSIGGLYDIPHGLVCGTLMAATNKFTVKKLRKNDPDARALGKYEELGRLFLEEKDKSQEYYIDAFIDYLYKMTELLAIPELGKYGVIKEDIEYICARTDNKNNPVKLDREELAGILKERIEI